MIVNFTIQVNSSDTVTVTLTSDRASYRPLPANDDHDCRRANSLSDAAPAAGLARLGSCTRPAGPGPDS